jgi:signal transduction histidine kinase
VRYEPEAVVVEITDDGRGATAVDGRNGTGPGYGLVGMRERAVAVGGRLDAGPAPGGGFRVAARLPVRSASA